MSNGLGRGSSPTPFEPVRDAYRLQVPQAALERLCDLAQVHAHFRPTFANAMRELLAKSHRWHRMASRSVEMDAVAKELGQIGKDARKLKDDLDKLSPQARMTLGLYALRLDKFGELDPAEAVRNQIEDLVNAGGTEQAGPKVGQLSWVAGRIEIGRGDGDLAKTEKRGPGVLEKRRRPERPTDRYLQSFCGRAWQGGPGMQQPAPV